MVKPSHQLHKLKNGVDLSNNAAATNNMSEELPDLRCKISQGVAIRSIFQGELFCEMPMQVNINLPAGAVPRTAVFRFRK